MMKIHTTQDLISTRRNQPTNNENIPINEIRLKHSSIVRKNFGDDRAPQDSVSFKGKKEFLKVCLDKLADSKQKETIIDKFLKSKACDSMLEMMHHEVFVQSAISAVICCLARPLTIMALPSKDKDNNKYASAHSISSGIVGVIASFLISVPFSKGIKYAHKNLLQKVKPEYLKRMFPHLDINSIKGANGTIKSKDNWLDTLGNKFSNDTKSVMLVAKPKAIGHVAESTLKNDFGLDIDIKKMAGKPVSQWVDRQGNPINLRPQDMFVQINEEGMGKNYFSLGFMDKKFMAEVFDDLDINTIERNGQRLNPRDWKNKNGQPFRPDLLDNVYVSSWNESLKESIPLYSGTKRIETNGKKATKYCAYQTNIENYDYAKVPDKLGTEISQEMLDADANSTVLNKCLIWFPDIITRPAVAVCTIALIPSVLKRVFHLEKHKKPEVNIQQQQLNNNFENDKILSKNLQAGKVVA